MGGQEKKKNVILNDITSLMELYRAAIKTTDGEYVDGNLEDGKYLKVAVLGDSIFAPILNDIQKNLLNRECQIALIDFAYPGKRAEDGKAAIEDVISKQPDVVVVELGGNDGNPKIIEESLIGIIQSLHQAKIRVALIGVQSIDVPHLKEILVAQYGREEAAQMTMDFDAVFTRLKTGQHTPDYYYPSLFRGLSYPQHFADLLHPNKGGQSILVDNITAFIQEIALKENARKSGEAIVLPQTDLNYVPPQKPDSLNIPFFFP